MIKFLVNCLFEFVGIVFFFFYVTLAVFLAYMIFKLLL